MHFSEIIKLQHLKKKRHSFALYFTAFFGIVVLWVVPTNTGIFYARFKTMYTKQNLVLFVSEKKIGGKHAFFRDIKASISKKEVINCFVFYCFFWNCCPMGGAH